MHTAFIRNHIKLLSVGYIQYNCFSIAPENASVVFKESVLQTCAGAAAQEVLLFFAVCFWLILELSIERS